ncbi:MAG: HAD-IC family P-type ATPase, partial [Myxococcota bacterium]|nr:HAD-IC family P-type ATPase [Myxococcota bacterium]
FRTVLAISSSLPDGTRLDAERRVELERRALEWGRRGVRVLGVASRRLRAGDLPELSAERELVFQGFVTFLDRPKAGVANAIATLAARGVQVKIITGDSRPVAEYVAQLIALPGRRVLTGSELDSLSEEALWRRAEDTELFVEVDPNHKERIIRALKKAGHVVGFLGDGVNDAPAMHVADVSLSVDQAVDVARATADLVLLEPGLDVIRRGIEEGRKTFANTLKYVLTTTSANLGNMVSMALASLFLPFLPLLPGQILLNNFLSDIPALGLADDRVDVELVNAPRRWDIRFVGRFMLEFGALSSLFDCITFAVLLLAFNASIDTFRTGWFIESLLTELVIAIIIRTRRPFFRSRPGRLLSVATLVLIPLTLALPFLPHARLLGFVPLQAPILAALVAITMVYVATAELTKAWFYRQTGRSSRAQTLRG